MLHILEILYSTKEKEEDPDPNFPAGSDTALPRVGSVPHEVPFPAVFNNVVKTEWEAPTKPKSNHPIMSKLYSLVPEAAEKLKLPLVDVTSICRIICFTLWPNT